jgi:hypothetical protein
MKLGFVRVAKYSDFCWLDVPLHLLSFVSPLQNSAASGYSAILLYVQNNFSARGLAY